MSSNEMKVGIVVGVTVGIFAAQIVNQTIKDLKDKLHEEAVYEAERVGWHKGWNDANRNPVNIRTRFEEMFGKPNLDDRETLED